MRRSRPEAGRSARPIIRIINRKLLLIFLRRSVYEETVTIIDTGPDRPEIDAATRAPRAFQRVAVTIGFRNEFQ
jgi:hypothetical protein